MRTITRSTIRARAAGRDAVSWLKRTGLRLARKNPDLAYLAVTYGPALGFAALAKLKRIHWEIYISTSSPLQKWIILLENLRSELFFFAALVAFWAGLFACCRRTPGRLAVAIIAYLVSLIVAATEIAGNVLFWGTGDSGIAFETILHAVGDFNELLPVIQSETPALIYALLLVYVIFPPMVMRLLPWRIHRSTDPLYRVHPRTGFLATSVLLFLVACLPGYFNAKSESRDITLNAALSMASGWLDPTLGATAVEHAFPTDTRLEATAEADELHVAIVVLESVRASAVTLYNPALPTTDFLASLADRSIVVDRAYSTVNHTTKALTSILCGIFPNPVRQVVEALPGGMPARCLAELLSDRGYATAFIQSATRAFERREFLVQNMGYQDFLPLESMDTTGFERANYFGFEDDVMLEPSRKWLEGHKGQPTFATYLTVTTHHQYDTPTRYGTLHLAEDEALNRYLNGVRYLDNFLRKLFEQYRRLGLYERTLFVIVGDHGEGFGEHGREGHDTVPYEEGIRVPLVVHDPRRALRGPERVDGLRNHLDILPTLVDLLGFEVVDATYEGRSLLEVASADRTMSVSCLSAGTTCMALLGPRYKAIHFFGFRPDELFDLEIDPGETTNLAAALPNELNRRVRGSRAWLDTLRMRHARYHEDRARSAKLGSGLPNRI